MGITLEGAGSGTLRFISGNATAANSIEQSEEERISVQEDLLGVPDNDDRFEFSLPAWSVGVLEIEAAA